MAGRADRGWDTPVWEEVAIPVWEDLVDRDVARAQAVAAVGEVPQLPDRMIASAFPQGRCFIAPVFIVRGIGKQGSGMSGLRTT